MLPSFFFFWLSLQTTLNLIKIPILFLSLCKSALINLRITFSNFIMDTLINFVMDTTLQHIIHLCVCVCSVHFFGLEEMTNRMASYWPTDFAIQNWKASKYKGRRLLKKQVNLVQAGSRGFVAFFVSKTELDLKHVNEDVCSVSLKSKGAYTRNTKGRKRMGCNGMNQSGPLAPYPRGPPSVCGKGQSGPDEGGWGPPGNKLSLGSEKKRRRGGGTAGPTQKSAY